MGKDIDSIYRDHFKGAKMPPPADSWEDILSQMPQKREKRRLLPLWFKLAGVAAVLAIIFAAYLQNSGPSVEVNYVITTSPGEKLELFTSEVSVNFDEVMRESGILLQALILQNREVPFQEGQDKVASETEENSGRKDASARGISILEPGKSVEIADTEVELLEKDSVENIDPAEELPAVAELVPKDEPEVITPKNEDLKDKFKISTRVAPVYLNNFGKANALNSGFSQKDASGEVTFSYGVSVAYNVSEKVNIRSGLHKVNLEYNTHEVSFNEVAAASSPEKNMEATILASPTNGTLSQKMGFLEVPLEVEYVLLDNKFAVGIIGGGSILFLEENGLLLDLPGLKTDLGESGNMNNLSYTTNLGLSLGYDLSKQVQLSLEPVVKFQMNTLNTTGGSKPYFFGLYSGFSYRF